MTVRQCACSICGRRVQVYSTIVLRPQQRVKFVLPPERGSVKTTGVVAWSTFEMAPTPRYRAGIAFATTIPVIDDLRLVNRC